MSTINSAYVPQSFYKTDAPTELVNPKLAESVQAGVLATLDKLPPIGDEFVKAQIRNLAPEDLDTPEELKAVLDRLETAGAKLAAFAEVSSSAFTGDVAKFLARAMVEFAGQQRQQAADDRMTARQAAKAELLNQASEMKSAADKMMAGAITNLVVGTVSSAVSLAGSIKSFKGQIGELKTMAGAARQSSQAAETIDSLKDSASAAKLGAPKGKSSSELDVEVDVKIGMHRTQTKVQADKTEMLGDAANVKLGTGTPGAKGGKSVLADSDAAVSQGNRQRSGAVTERPETGAGSTESSIRKAEIDKAKADSTFAMAEKRAQASMTEGQIYETAGSLGKSVGAGVDGTLQAQAKYDEAEGQVNAAESQYYQQIADGKKDVEDSMKEMVSQIINFIKEMREAEVDAMRSLTRV